MTPFHYYKTLRTSIRKLDPYRALYVIWAYHRHLVSRKTLPQDIQVDQEYLRSDIIQKRRSLAEWDLENLSREIILHAGHFDTQKELKKWGDLAHIVNKAKRLVDSNERYNKSSLWHTLFKIAHQQFPWYDEAPPNANFVIRYYKILVKPPVLDRFSLGLRYVFR